MHNEYVAKDMAITVRVPAQLKRRLEQRAKREHRSISGQVLHELERAVAEDSQTEPREAALGMCVGAALPSDADLLEVRSSLWGRLGNPNG